MGLVSSTNTIPLNSCQWSIYFLSIGNYVTPNGEAFTVVDTPGFGDTDDMDSQLIDEMVGVLKNDIKTSNGFMLLFNAADPRFNTLLQRMLREIEVMFGKDFWNFVILGFSHWGYDKRSVSDRKRK